MIQCDFSEKSFFYFLCFSSSKTGEKFRFPNWFLLRIRENWGFLFPNFLVEKKSERLVSPPDFQSIASCYKCEQFMHEYNKTIRLPINSKNENQTNIAHFVKLNYNY